MSLAFTAGQNPIFGKEDLTTRRSLAIGYRVGVSVGQKRRLPALPAPVGILAMRLIDLVTCTAGDCS